MKRVLSFLLCCTLCIGVFAYQPMQVKAVAVVDDAVVGSMALASYLSATGVELTVIEGGAGAVSAGMGALAGEYAAATGAAASGEAFLSSVAAGTALSAAGTIVLTAAAVATCAGLAYWLYTTYLVDAEGNEVPLETPVSVFSDPDVGILLADGSVLPIYYSGSLDYSGSLNGDISLIAFGSTLELANGSSIHSYVEDGTGCSVIDFLDASGSLIKYRDSFGRSSSAHFSANDSFFSFCFFSFDEVAKASSKVYLYFKSSVFPKGNNIGLGGGTFKQLFGSLTSMQLSASKTAFYDIPEVRSDQQLEIDVGAAPGVTLEELVDTVPQQIADNELTASATVTDVDPVAGTSGILDYVAAIWRLIKALPITISNAVKSVFEPDAALLTEITTTFNNKFGWLETLYRLGEDLLGMTADSAPPVIYIHLEDAEGQFRYGGTEKALDMSWYQPYKEDVDNILSGFMWLAFLWLVFKRAPAIIQGGEMISEYSHDIDQGYHDRKEWHR